jgi:hypothetical protein
MLNSFISFTLIVEYGFESDGLRPAILYSI